MPLIGAPCLAYRVSLPLVLLLTIPQSPTKCPGPPAPAPSQAHQFFGLKCETRDGGHPPLRDAMIPPQIFPLFLLVKTVNYHQPIVFLTFTPSQE